MNFRYEQLILGAQPNVTEAAVSLSVAAAGRLIAMTVESPDSRRH